jgi:hypothetical protein
MLRFQEESYDESLDCDGVPSITRGITDPDARTGRAGELRRLHDKPHGAERARRLAHMTILL